MGGKLMEPGITAIILICSATLAISDCTIETATDMMQGLDANTPIECAMSSQALIAQSALRHGLDEGQYFKVVCVQKGEAVQALRLHPSGSLGSSLIRPAPDPAR
jgi:hypothetical protein